MISKVMGTDAHGLMLNGKKKKTQVTDIAQYDSICLKTNKQKKKPHLLCRQRCFCIFVPVLRRHTRLLQQVKAAKGCRLLTFLCILLAF